MKEYKADCPGCGRICLLTIQEQDNGQYILKGNTCPQGKHGALKKWDFLREDNITIEEKKVKEEKKSKFGFLKILGSKR